MDDKIVSAKIHPGIGVARLGNSVNEFIIGPEVPFPRYLAAGSYKDSTGAIKRQAARFRVYGYNAAGEVVRELTAADAEIRWNVHVANQKAALGNRATPSSQSPILRSPLVGEDQKTY